MIYAGMVGTALAFALARAFLFYHVSLMSSEELHDKMALAILKAPVLFFDTNPVGRILNRFSKDVGTMDEVLPNFFIASLQLNLMAMAGILVPAVVNYWILFAVVPLVSGFLYIANYYLRSSRELKRLESICRSPVFSHMSETINGLDTIRSRKRQADFIKEFYGYVYRLNHFNIKEGESQVFFACLLVCLFVYMFLPPALKVRGVTTSPAPPLYPYPLPLAYRLNPVSPEPRSHI